MKKLFLLVAFTGIIGASSALTVASLSKGNLISIGGEEKKADKKKCDKNKACCKKDSEAKLSKNEAPMGKSCQGASKSKSCCKGGKKDAKTAETAATPAN